MNKRLKRILLFSFFCVLSLSFFSLSCLGKGDGNRTKIPRCFKSIETTIDTIIRNENLDGFSPELIKAIIFYESRFRPGVSSSANSIGLMGIRPKTQSGKDIWSKALRAAGIIKGDSDLFRPEPNIKAGIFILDNLRNRFGNNLLVILTRYTGSRALAQKYIVKYHQYEKLARENKKAA